MLDKVKRLFWNAKFARTIYYHLRGYEVAGTSIRGLHLGPGDEQITDFLGVDANIHAKCDIVAGINRLKFKSGSVDTIYASHVFEHVPGRSRNTVLAEWSRVLRAGGELYILVPDLEALAAAYLENIQLYETSEGRSRADLAIGIIFGGQANRFDFHYYGYSFATLKSMLIEVGFQKVERFDRAQLDFAPFRDAGFAAIAGRPVSLNMLATK